MESFGEKAAANCDLLVNMEMLGLIGFSGPKVRGMEDGLVSDIWHETVDLLSQSRSWVSPEISVTWDDDF